MKSHNLSPVAQDRREEEKTEMKNIGGGFQGEGRVIMVELTRKLTPVTTQPFYKVVSNNIDPES